MEIAAYFQGMKMIKFNLITKHKKARLGQIITKHGVINTPAFMAVGTQGTVKAMLPESVGQTGTEVVLGNTYHLMLRPTAERIAEFGGLHKFMNWPNSILTDSGGFQVMSLSALRKINEAGVTFNSHIDGSKHLLSPERSMEIQNLLGSDITMCFDECTKYPATFDEAKASMELSLRWAQRSKDAFVEREGYGLFGIIQGSIYPELREISAAKMSHIGFDGYAIGGLAVGEGQEMMLKTLDYSADLLPKDKPRYLMGVGTPEDLIKSVYRGIDMFDCVMPTRAGRNGLAFTRKGKINIRNAKYATDETPLDEQCTCPACINYSRAYLHHTVKAKEIIASMLMTWHNIQFYQDLMKTMRGLIEKNQMTDDCEFIFQSMMGY
jgi:queuine tRNA-ribosyltransferase